MQKLNPKKASENPLAASILGAVLVKASQESGDPGQKKAGLDLIKIAEASPDKMPRLAPNSKLAQAVKAAKKAMQPMKGVPSEDSKAALRAKPEQ